MRRGSNTGLRTAARAQDWLFPQPTFAPQAPPFEPSFAQIIYLVHALGCVYWFVAVVELRRAIDGVGAIEQSETLLWDGAFMPPTMYASYLPGASRADRMEPSLAPTESSPANPASAYGVDRLLRYHHVPASAYGVDRLPRCHHVPASAYGVDRLPRCHHAAWAEGERLLRQLNATGGLDGPVVLHDTLSC